jgi:hypothetical protein
MANTPAAAPAIPFAVASQYSSRRSFDPPTVTLAAGALTNVTPIQVPAVGYATALLMEVTIDGAGGTAPAFTADGPWNVIQQISVRNAGGSNLIAPVTGYELFLMNLLAGQGNPGFGSSGDPRYGLQYDATAPDGHYFVWLPFIIDPSDAYGVIPATASNANYQVDITLSSIAELMSGTPTPVTVNVRATAYYFDIPAPVDVAGRAQAVMPASQAVSVWQKETPSVNPGERLIKSNNVGNVLRQHIFTVRDDDGARVDTDWPDLFEVYLDNQMRFAWPKNEHEFLMARWHGLGDVAKGNGVGQLPAGVFSIPWHTLLGSQAGDPNNTRAQLLPTLDASLLQFRFQSMGPTASRLEILTQSVSTTDAGYLFSK